MLRPRPRTADAHQQEGPSQIIRAKDRKLQEAFDWRFDAFMTMKRRLRTAAAFIERETGLRVMRPTRYWSVLSSFTALYRLSRERQRTRDCQAGRDPVDTVRPSRPSRPLNGRSAA
jgi:hypothetical protein